MKPVYIVLSGTASVGKTTLAEALIPLLESVYGEPVEYIKEVARSVSKKYDVQLNKEASSKTQRMIEDEYARIEGEKQNSTLLADRSIIDRYAYTILNNGTKEDKSDLLDWYQNNTEEICKKYSHIFFIPLADNLKLELDGVRSADEGYRREIDTLQKDIIDRYNINVHYLYGSTKERLEQIKEVLEIDNGVSFRITNGTPRGSRET